MQVSISAGGTPANVRQDIKRSLEQQLGGRAVTPGAPELAEAVRTYVDRQLDGVPGTASVSVSASVLVSVSKPAALGTSEAAVVTEPPDPAAAAVAKAGTKKEAQPS